MTADKKELSHAEQNAAGWLESIKEHVACLDADRERLEELRDERDNWEVPEEDEDNDKASWTRHNPDDATELAELEKTVTIEGEEIDDADIVRERIQESVLSVQVRYGWISPGATDEMLKDGPEEYEILLSTGGPALRIIGELDQHCQPRSARLQHQDWGTPWTEWVVTGDDHDDLMRWVNVFCFGE